MSAQNPVNEVTQRRCVPSNTQDFIMKLVSVVDPEASGQWKVE